MDVDVDVSERVADVFLSISSGGFCQSCAHMDTLAYATDSSDMEPGDPRRVWV